ncbi:MAG: hypothetical protein E7163_04065 [Firmicutes bacterium]|nr:hypothetical protein [Bacillota bacterium]
MPVVKVYDMSTIEKVKDTYNETVKLRECSKYNEYSNDSIMLIRTTGIFPEGRIIKPLSEVSFIAKTRSNFIYQAVESEIDYEELKKFETYEMYYRSTVHFTENGLVSSHMYGNFDNQDFIIMDPLSEHLGVSDIRNFAGQDTFIKGNVTLSKKAIIIVKAEKYESIKAAYPEIDDFNVILYYGIPEDVKEKYILENEDKITVFDVNDQRAVVEKVLMDLGYTPELIGSHYIINSPTSEKINTVNETLGEKYGVLANSKHNYSDEYNIDLKNNIFISETFNKLLLAFIIKMHNIDSTIINIDDSIGSITAHKLIELIDIDVIVKDIELFNYTLEKMRNLDMLPISQDLVDNNIPDIYSAYLRLDIEAGKKLS